MHFIVYCHVSMTVYCCLAQLLGSVPFFFTKNTVDFFLCFVQAPIDSSRMGGGYVAPCS